MIRPSDIHRFTTGDCHVLARALNVLTDWPIHTFTTDWHVLDIHAFVMAPKNRPLDIEGLHLLDTFKYRWRGYDIKGIVQTTWKDIRDDWGGTAYGKYSFHRAKKLAPYILESHGF